jgi:hypothetical protein
MSRLKRKKLAKGPSHHLDLGPLVALLLFLSLGDHSLGYVHQLLVRVNALRRSWGGGKVPHI